MKAMIFAAGLGTRFKPWTDHHPKALAIVNQKSLLQRNIEYLQSFGITEVVVNVHHFADQVIQAIEANQGWGSKVIISDEREEVLETGGGLLKAASLLQTNETFLTINADILTNLDLHQILAFHASRQALVTVSVTNRKASRHFLFNEGNRLCGWENNQTGEQKISIHHTPLHPMGYTCVSVFSPGIFEAIPQRGKFSLTDTYLQLAAEHLILGYDHSGDTFIDVGKPESVAIAETLFP